MVRYLHSFVSQPIPGILSLLEVSILKFFSSFLFVSFLAQSNISRKGDRGIPLEYYLDSENSYSWSIRIHILTLISAYKVLVKTLIHE